VGLRLVSVSVAAELRPFTVAVEPAADLRSELPEISLSVLAAHSRRIDRPAFESSMAVDLDRCTERQAFTGRE